MKNLKNKAVIGSLVMAFMLLGLPGLTQAATYGYVANDGYVRTIVANSWQEAINTAIQISRHSGVILFQNASDFTMVGTYVSSANN